MATKSKNIRRAMTAMLLAMAVVWTTGCEKKDKTDLVDEVEDEAVDKITEEPVVTKAPRQIVMPITFVNNTDIDIYNLYASTTDTDDWEEDLLGDTIMEPGDYAEINFYYDTDNLIWDFAIVDNKENKLEFYNLDLGNYNEQTGITIYLEDDGTADISVGSEEYQDALEEQSVNNSTDTGIVLHEYPLTFANETGADIYNLYQKSPVSGDWSDSFLDDNTVLEAGDDITFDWFFESDNMNIIIVIEDSYGNTLEYDDIDLEGIGPEGAIIGLYEDGIVQIHDGAYN